MYTVMEQYLMAGIKGVDIQTVEHLRVSLSARLRR